MLCIVLGVMGSCSGSFRLQAQAAGQELIATGATWPR